MNASMFGSIPFIPGDIPSKPEHLSRFLPPVPDGVISVWLKMNIPQGSWILEPFGASPRLALEAARAGYRVLVTVNNPIIRFLIEMMADPPKEEELKAALAELSASYVGNERTEPHIRSLYNTYCTRCGQIVSADFFIWEHGNPSPYMRSYTCPNCGDSGDYPCTAYDAELSSKFTSTGLHKARALERVVASTDQDRIHVEQALSVYVPRALYALITIINRIEGLKISPVDQKYLNALLLYAFDQADAMWKIPSQKEKRRQLTIPRHFREKNIWYALEEGINLWSKDDTDVLNESIPVTTWPELPSSNGGICIYEGRFINLADSLKDINIKSVCTVIPRPNQAFWTLSALWAGWLWGREAIRTFKSVLRRQRYDWAWHTTALSSVYKQLTNSLEPATTFFGLINEAEPGFICSAIVAAGVAGCHLESMALRTEQDQAQIVWKCDRNPELTQISSSLSQVAVQSAKSYLEKRAEPASYLNTITAAFMGITKSWNSKIEQHSGGEKISLDITPGTTRTSEQVEPTPSLFYTSIYNSAREALSFRSGFLRYNLQDGSNVEAANKSQIIQSSLFDLKLSVSAVGDNETENPESTSPDNVPESGKERPTRSSDISESTLLWLRETNEVNHTPITDSYELNLVKYLFGHPGCTMQEIDIAMCELFTGLFTPDFEFMRLCLESYATPDPLDSNRWYVRPEDDLSKRKIDIEQATRFIHQIGEQLGFICNDHLDSSAKTYITWLDENGDQYHRFFPIVSAAFGEIVLYGERPPIRGFIVLPGSRANLIVYKLRRDPRISKAFDPSQGYWRFLKFRHLRSLAESPILNRENLDQLLGLDPITVSTPQIRLI
jgi:hypothetical protein